jgi:dTDP-4-dehydrorhamnose reductase
VRIAITGAAGMLAHAVASVGTAAGHDVIALDRSALDVTQSDAVHTMIVMARPDAVIHCAAYTRVDDAEDDPATAELVNAIATGHVAAAAAACDAAFVFPSTDYVFDGRADSPYRPDAPTNPLNAYGASKLHGEQAATAAPRHYVVRTSWLYGANGRNFVTTMLAHGRAGNAVRVVDDQRGTPTWTVDVARMIFGLLDAAALPGIYHATDAGETTWYDFARAIFDAAGVAADVTPVPSDAYPQKAERPRYSVLDCSTTWSIAGAPPDWRDSLSRALPDLL